MTPSRKRGFIARAIAADPRAALLDGLAFLGFFRADVSRLKSRYAFNDPRIAEAHAMLLRGIDTELAIRLPDIGAAEKERLRSRRGRAAGTDGNQPDVMEDYWILFHELARRIARHLSHTGEPFFVFATAYHALVHGMYNAVMHGAPGDIDVRVWIQPAALTLELENPAAADPERRPNGAEPAGDNRPQYYTRQGIHVGGRGNARDTFAQVFDHADLVVAPPDPATGAGSATLTLRMDLSPRSAPARMRRAFLGRALIARDLRQLAAMAGQSG